MHPGLHTTLTPEPPPNFPSGHFHYFSVEEGPQVLEVIIYMYVNIAALAATSHEHNIQHTTYNIQPLLNDVKYIVKS